MVYLTLEDWTNFFIPKLYNHYLFVEEFKQTKKIHNIILEIISLIFPNKNNSENKLKLHILYASMIYYYKYLLYNRFTHSDISEIDKVLICASCIFLSFKGAEKQINIDFLSGKLLPCLNNNSENKKYLLEDIKNFIKKYEYDILNSIGFNMGIDNPYDFLKYLKHYLKNISIKGNVIEEIIQLVNNYINYSLLFPLFLYYSSYEIALSCILLAKESKYYYFININKFIQMYQLQVDTNKILKCSKHISKISNFLTKKNNTDDNSKNEIKKNNTHEIHDNNAENGKIINNKKITEDNIENEIIMNPAEFPNNNIKNEINFNAIANIQTNQM